MQAVPSGPQQLSDDCTFDCVGGYGRAKCKKYDQQSSMEETLQELERPAANESEQSGPGQDAATAVVQRTPSTVMSLTPDLPPNEFLPSSAYHLPCGRSSYPLFISHVSSTLFCCHKNSHAGACHELAMGYVWAVTTVSLCYQYPAALSCCYCRCMTKTGWARQHRCRAPQTPT